MSVTRPSSDLNNNYNEISELCHKFLETVFITKNGKDDLAVMSIETYELLNGRLELYSLLEKGLQDDKNGDIVSFCEGLDSIRSEISDR